jgi:hypothetical protein
MERAYTEAVGDLWMPEVQATFNDLRGLILCNPCLRRFDPLKITILRTDFSAKGFGYVVCQSDNGKTSLALASQFMSGNGFHFLTKKDGRALYPVAFGSRRARRNEKFLHSYLREGFCGDWAMNKVCHMCYGRRFVWVTSCYAVKFILSYDGAIQAILCLQIRLMGWDVDIVHRTNDYLTDAKYWSCLDADLCYDLSFQHYIHLVAELCKTHPPPTNLPMQTANMPYYRGPRIPSEHSLAETSTDTMMQEVDGQAEEHVDAIASALISSIITQGDNGNTSLCNRPLQFGTLTSGNNKGSVRALYNSKFPTLAYQSTQFTWAVYGFNSGHVPSTISKRNHPFWVILECDPYKANRALFQEFVTSCPPVLPSAASLLDHICGSGNQRPIDGYLIHSHCYQMSKPTSMFWAIQASIVVQLWMIRQLNLFMAFVHPDHDG